MTPTAETRGVPGHVAHVSSVVSISDTYQDIITTGTGAGDTSITNNFAESVTNNIDIASFPETGSL